MVMAQKIIHITKTDSIILWYRPMYSEFELETNMNTNKILIAPQTIDYKENVLLCDFFNPNPIKIIKKGTNR